MNIFKTFLRGAAVLLVILLVLAVSLTLDWPLWVGFFVVLLLTGATIGGYLLLRLWLRHRERNFVQEIAEQGTSRMKDTAGREHQDLKELRERWQEAIATLRGSHLKKHGNPLYVLPWYLVIGESGSGKTASLNSARLSSPITEKSCPVELSGTKNCEWRFWEQAIVIDTAGRYAVPADEGADKVEWRNFLRLLVKYRRREPLNGLIVTVAADRLLSDGSEALAGGGRIVRCRIDELMRGLGVRFPVYLLVTKCDLIHGMIQFCEHLPEQSLDRPMGIINHDSSTDVAAFLENALATIGDRLRKLRLHLLSQSKVNDPDMGLLLFPEEFANLKQGLAAFMDGAFGTNHYQETPILRGLFFSSGQQNGNPHSHFAEQLGMAGEQQFRAETTRGLFLHDFFSKILPQDRGKFAPTRRAIEWQNITGNLGLVSWMAVFVALCGLLSFSFLKNLSTIRQISQELARPPEMRGELLSDLIVMERYRQGIVAVEERNRHWWMPRFGLTESLKVEKGLKSRFCRQFHDGFLGSFDRRMTENIAAISPAATDEEYAEYIVHLARRINLLRARQAGQSSRVLRVMPQPGYITLDASADPGATPEVKKKFGSLNLSYLSWRSDSADICRDLKLFQSSLKQLIALKGADLQWLVAWVESHGGSAPVTLAEFWGGSQRSSDERRISPAFTRKGKEEIESLIREIEAALPDPQLATAKQAEFERWYRFATFASWQAFATAFPRGAERLRGEQEWQLAAGKMATDEGPYFALLNRILLELEPLTREGNLPPWLQQLYKFRLVQTEAAVRQSQAVNRASDGGKKILVSLKKKIGKEASAENLASDLVRSQAYRDYRTALTAIAPMVASRSQAYQAAARLYAEDPAVGKSPFITAFTTARQLKTGLAGDTGDTAVDEPIARLVNGPLEFLWSYVRKEAAGYLQREWEEQVLTGTLGMTGQQAAPMLLGTDGLAWKFVKGPAAPFLTRSLRGYRAKEVLGGTLQFEGAFLSFLDKGNQVQAAALTRQSNYSVGIQGLPTDANPEARIKPHATRLELQCGGSSQSLANLNYPVGKTFNWSPDNCGDVQFQIEVGDLLLTRSYLGPQAFPEFLQSFPGGRRTFYPGDFPGERNALERMGIRYIRANYRFVGSGQIIKQIASISGQVPRKITRY